MNLPTLFKTVGLCALLSLGGCFGDSEDPPPVVAAALPDAAGSWTKFVPTSMTMDGRTITPTCSKAPGSVSDYHFWAKRGSVNKVVVYFEGGGACWDGATCSAQISAAAGAAAAKGLYKSEILASDVPTLYGGLFDNSNSANPVKDWSMVYVPYCTGDIHTGSNTASYVNPFTQQAYTIEHRGADNFQVVLTWMRSNFHNPDEVLVTGSSAGGYGAIVNYPKVRKAFPNGRGVMLADGAQGVTPTSFDTVRNSAWNPQLDSDVYGASAQATPTSALMRKLAERYPNDRMAQYTSSYDLVQIQFYDIMVNGLTGTQGTACQAWIDGMFSNLTQTQTAANFRSYVGSGTTHTLLRGTTNTPAGTPLYYNDTSGGTPFITWLGKLLGTDSLSNATCTGCTTFPAACPV